MVPAAIGIQVGFRANDEEAQRRFGAVRPRLERVSSASRYGSTARDVLLRFLSRCRRINHFTYTTRWRAEQYREDTQQNGLCFQCSPPAFSTQTLERRSPVELATSGASIVRPAVLSQMSSELARGKCSHHRLICGFVTHYARLASLPVLVSSILFLDYTRDIIQSGLKVTNFKNS